MNKPAQGQLLSTTGGFAARCLVPGEELCSEAVQAAVVSGSIRCFAGDAFLDLPHFTQDFRFGQFKLLDHFVPEAGVGSQRVSCLK